MAILTQQRRAVDCEEEEERLWEIFVVEHESPRLTPTPAIAPAIVALSLSDWVYKDKEI